MKRKLRTILVGTILVLAMVFATTAMVSAASVTETGTEGDLTWTVYDDGTLEITGTGDYYKGSSYSSYEAPWEKKYATTITKVVVNVDEITNCARMFYNLSNVESIDLTGLDTSQLTNMVRMFEGSGITSIQFPDSFNTSQVKLMSGLLSDCKKLTSVKFGAGFDTSNVTQMDTMFQGCESLTSLDLSSFQTGKVSTMDSMFYGCSSLTSLTFGENFDTGAAGNLEGMFRDCSSLTSLDLSKFNTTSARRVPKMFQGCSSLTYLDLSSFELPNLYEEEYNYKEFLDGCSNLDTLKTPKKLKMDISLPTVDMGSWRDQDGTVYTTLPKEKTTSIEISSKYREITFNYHGGSESVEKRMYKVGEAYGVLPQTDKTGYLFQGWYTEALEGEQVTADSLVGGDDTTLHAHWEKYAEITFKGNGGTVNFGDANSNNFRRAPGAEYGTLPSASRDGYQFLGWFTAADGTGVQVSETSTVSGDVTLYAHWELLPETCTIGFDGNGGAVTAKTLTKDDFQKEKGSTFGTLPEATRSGYTFLGWFTAGIGGTQITSDSVVTENTTLYAQWKQNVTAPGKVTISKTKRTATTKATVTWKKVSDAKGYEVVYSTSKSLKSAKKVTTTSTSGKLTKLTKNKKYYVKVRAYKLDGKTKIYGSYSAVKTIKAK